MMQGSALVVLLLVVASSFTDGEANQQSPQECTNKSAVNISHLIGLRYHRSRKVENVHKLTEDLEEMEELLNNTLEDVEGVDASIKNLTTPKIRDLDFSQTCDTKIPMDCCQVRSIPC